MRIKRRHLQKNTTKAKLQSGETVFGCFVRYPDPTLIEVQGYLGWDFLVFDGEHGTLEPRECENLVRAAELRGVTPVVRVTTNLAPVILRFLDTGAQGVHVPWVNTGEEAERAVRAVKYFPRGNRGLAGVRASDFAQAGSLGDYIITANSETLVVLQVETAEAVEHLPKIVAVEGVDVIFIGPNDLSHSLGLAGQMDHPKVKAVLERILQVVLPSNKALGIMVGNANAAREWKQRGARYITITLDSVACPAVRAYLSTCRA
jgi:4-hydroxy-2-oxoheptanedioate aldolase